MGTVRIVVYLRVSTDRQGKSGLGLEAQQEAVTAFAKQHSAKILETFTEVESGKNAGRPELAKAIARAKRQGVTLVVAKLDRLARNLHFTSCLMESGVEFVAIDNPHATRLTIHILAAVAEDEARRISERTKAALTAYKARGGVLGAARPECRNLTTEARQRGAVRAGEVLRAAAKDAYADLIPTMRELRDEGLSLRGIANRLNEEGHTTRRGLPWNQVQVMRVLG